MDYLCISEDVKLGKDVRLAKFINLYGCTIGDNTKIGAFVEVQKNATIGRNCKISSHTFICEGVTIEDDVFIGHGVTFVNDSYPRATAGDGRLQTEADWTVEPTLVQKGASIGSGATILAKVTIGEGAIVGAGSVVTKSVPPGSIVAGNPAKVLRKIIGESDCMNVPYLDLKAQYAAIKDEIHAAIGEVMEKTAFAGGPFVAGFEQEFARFCNCKHAMGVGNGTDALWLSLLALGIGPGDEVITVPNTFIATAAAVTYCGAKPVFVDVEEKTYNMDPSLLEAAITPRTKAIIPVHLFGQTADMDPILAIAKAHGLLVVEDACQAHGAEYKGRKAGSMGATGCFSFYPGKNLGAYGEGGAVVTNDDAIAEKIRMFRDQGQSKKYYHSVIGWNARLDGIQGAVLSVKLKYLAGWNEARREHAREYTRLLSSVDGVIEPREADYAKHIYHIYAIRTGQRDRLMTALAEQGISCGIHYPVPIHLQEAYRCLGLARGSFPVAEKCAEEFLSLPMFPELTTGQIAYVVDKLKLSLAPGP